MNEMRHKQTDSNPEESARKTYVVVHAMKMGMNSHTMSALCVLVMQHKKHTVATVVATVLLSRGNCTHGFFTKGKANLLFAHEDSC